MVSTLSTLQVPDGIQTEAVFCVRHFICMYAWIVAQNWLSGLHAQNIYSRCIASENLTLKVFPAVMQLQSSIIDSYSAFQVACPLSVHSNHWDWPMSEWQSYITSVCAVLSLVNLNVHWMDKQPEKHCIATFINWPAWSLHVHVHAHLLLQHAFPGWPACINCIEGMYRGYMQLQLLLWSCNSRYRYCNTD